ncbi:jg943 [Pararge aegeria aegeria]|uniref:Jg943 protein n=1 Tax=Pararge aegeria aegeria TaxID=348720 RepID=A0A8S4SPK8_9NEOP|nr:jg943 [Pararge aegeria aegeria]
MTYSNQACDSGEGICNLFSTCFHSTFLSNDSGSVDSIADVNSPVEQSINTNDIDSIEVTQDPEYKLLKSLNLNKSAGPDSLPLIFLVNCAKSLSYPVTMLQKSDDGTVPIIWKAAFITSIHKKAAKNVVGN